MNLMNAVGKISDEHIAEFAHVAPKKFYVAPWMKITAAAACLAVIVTGVPLVRKAISAASSVVTEINCSASVLDGPGMPCVTMNGITYMVDEDWKTLDKLPDGFEAVGRLSGSSEDDVYQWFDGSEVVYRHPSVKGEIYVYTDFLNGDDGYRYLHFTDDESYNYMSWVVFNGKVYIPQSWDYIEQLPSEYRNSGEVIGFDLKDFAKDGFVMGNDFSIGDSIYCDPNSPNKLYVDHPIQNKATHILCVEPIEFDPGYCGVDYEVFINNKLYKYDPKTAPDKLPEGYVKVGEVITNRDQSVNGYGSVLLNVGDEIYQNPNVTSELYVYSTYLSYHYVRLVDEETYILEGLDKYLFY